MTPRELAHALLRLRRAISAAAEPAGIEAVRAWGDSAAEDGPVSWSTLHRWLTVLGLPASPGLVEKDRANFTLTRAECVRHMWRALSLAGEWIPDAPHFLQPGKDADGDGIPDREDPLPFDRLNDNVPDHLREPPR
jgi:hypothetical protein